MSSLLPHDVVFILVAAVQAARQRGPAAGHNVLVLGRRTEGDAGGTVAAVGENADWKSSRKNVNFVTFKTLSLHITVN